MHQSSLIKATLKTRGDSDSSQYADQTSVVIYVTDVEFVPINNRKPA